MQESLETNLLPEPVIWIGVGGHVNVELDVEGYILEHQSLPFVTWILQYGAFD